MITANSKISEVTVFSDRAQITRTMTEKMTPGEHQVLFDYLPDAVDENSIQVNGKGHVTLKDVRFKQELFATIPDEKVKELYENKLALEDSVRELQDVILQAGQEKEFVNNIAKALTSETPENSSLELDPEKWLKMVNYYRSKLDEITKEIRETEKKERQVNNELQKVIRELRGLGEHQKKTRNQVEILIEVSSDEDVVLMLSYMVAGPCWYPVYDLRVSTETRKMDIVYNACIRQNSSEEWEDAAIKLSTARPQISGRQPELSPWFLDVYRPAPPPAPRKRELAKMKKEVMAASAGDIAEEAFSSMESEPEELVSDMAIPEATVETGATSVVFTVHGTHSIGSDNQPHKVTVLLESFDAQFQYSSVPRLSQYAYLKAKVTNKTEFPFLPGESNVFLDNNFVASSSLDLVAPSEEFSTFLGVDESMKVEYKFLKKYHKKEGMISRRDRLIYEYVTVITNNKKTEEEIVIQDQLPISQNEAIVVELVRPKYEKDTDRLKKNEFNYLEWFFEIPAGEKVEIPFVFAVEHAKDITVTGL